ncbi:MAG: hypothetical protein GKR90_26020 [Pseudomonadales bacterium]|nr:hypothetical protein [Pseudomonadales bacterium]
MTRARNSTAAICDAVKRTEQLFGALRDVVEQLSLEQYQVAQSPLESSIGAHLRHILEFYQLFLCQQSGESINYDKRRRCREVEHCKASALGLMQLLEDRLGTIHQERPISVVNEHGYWLSTSTARELHFLSDHTTHHMAMIAVACRLANVPISKCFGVSTATLRVGT